MILRFATHHTHPRPGNGQTLLCSGDTHITKPSFLLDLLVAIIRRDAHIGREKTILHAGKIDIRELQSLGTVQCHKDHIRSVVIQRVDIRNQSHFL